MKKVAVIGAYGNMGKRYALILEKYCNIEVVRIDMHNHISCDHSDCDGYIIATPTENHLIDICIYSQWKKPILCEKPIIKTKDDYTALIEIMTSDVDLSMINQYEFLDDKSSEGHTFYNYFKTGKDDLSWDCINIIGLARSSYDIKNDSLVWNCQINGTPIFIGDIDDSYIMNIKAWVNGQWRNKSYILPAHMKVLSHVKKD
jgi:hypothetical protein